jgi:hypothetical protein
VTQSWIVGFVRGQPEARRPIVSPGREQLADPWGRLRYRFRVRARCARTAFERPMNTASRLLETQPVVRFSKGVKGCGVVLSFISYLILIASLSRHGAA